MLRMELLIVRHGRPEEQVAEVGTADPGLTELGHQQSRAVAEYLMTQSVDHIISSPMQRARETAQPLCDLMGVEAEIIDDFKESDHEATEYLPMEEHRQTMIDNFIADPEGVFGSAGREAFFTRVNTAFKQVVADHGGKTVAVFCHGLVTAAFMCEVLGVDDPFTMAPDYTGLTRVRGSASHNVYSMRSFNETMHLRDLPDVRW